MEREHPPKNQINTIPGQYTTGQAFIHEIRTLPLPVVPPDLTIPPVDDKNLFMQSINAFLKRAEIPIDRQHLKIGNQLIDMYNIHLAVMTYGGPNVVRQPGTWEVVVEKAGWHKHLSEFSVAEIAKRVSMIYNLYLVDFDRVITASYLRKVELAHINSDLLRMHINNEDYIRYIEANRETLLQKQKRLYLANNRPYPPAQPPGRLTPNSPCNNATNINGSANLNINISYTMGPPRHPVPPERPMMNGDPEAWKITNDRVRKVLREFLLSAPALNRHEAL